MALSVSISSIGSTTATLSWSMTGVTSGNYPWEIDFTGTGASGDGLLRSTSSASGTVNISGLTPGTTYTWTGFVTYQSGNVAGPSQSVTGTTNAAPVTYTGSWDLGGGTGGGSYPTSVTAGQSISAPGTNPTRSGYNFAGWSVSFPYTPTSSGWTITASWTIIPATYTGSWDLGGGTGGGPYPTSVTAGNSISAPANPTRSGYNFAGWSVAFPYTPTSSGWSITASWSAVVVNYSITWDLAGGSGGGAYPASITAGSSISQPASPSRSGYDFAGWSVSFPYTPSGNTTITASWTPVVIPTYPPSWTDVALASAQIGVAYSDGVSATNMNYSGSYSISAGSLPAGLSLNTSTGAITGTPTVDGTFNFTVTAGNSYGSISQAFTFVVNAIPASGNANVWDGTQWVSAPVYVRNGSTWVLAPVYVWNGSSWVMAI